MEKQTVFINEEWKDVVGFEKYYMVSNLGNVSSKLRKVKGSTYKPKILKLYLNNNGYYSVCIHIRELKLSKTVSVHRLVAQAFIPNPDNLPEVNHKDFNTLNNNVDNLEWCTHEFNMKHMWKSKPPKRYSRGNAPCAKPISRYDMEGNIIKHYECIEDVKEDGFTPACVTRVCKGQRPQHKGYIFKYKDGANFILNKLKGETK